nr:hypothetical protein [Klebsiella variicola]
MTNITELAQLRDRTVDYPYYLVECDCGKIYPSSELSGGEPMGDSGDYSDCYCPHCGEGEEHFAECADPETAWKAQQDKIDALVEALEKAQTKANEQGRTACELFDEVTALRQRIAELESRTVKLPERYACELGYNAPDPNGDMLDRDDVIAALTDAGIKVEADIVDADVSDRNQPGMVVAVHIDAGDFVKFRGQVYEVKETDFDDHDVTLWFVCGETLKCAAGCQIEVVSAPREAE